MGEESQRLCHMSTVEHLRATSLGDQSENHDSGQEGVQGPDEARLDPLEAPLPSKRPQSLVGRQRETRTGVDFPGMTEDHRALVGTRSADCSHQVMRMLQRKVAVLKLPHFRMGFSIDARETTAEFK
ncbi:hypothetical protein KQX54_015129 [Cotesia glomerata]|uniref:Uncharacterized protein n=1 Tax=Cotesia glomerata TaxID=32391 RepID=A0AAV7IKI4_COTGL|nr:hypothetical protein KQX54_015129 [Cotesia glomerata]